MTAESASPSDGGHASGALRASLEQAVSYHRHVGQVVREVVADLRSQVRVLMRDLAASRAAVAELEAEAAGLRSAYEAALASNRELAEGFNALLRAVADADGTRVTAEGRMEAVLLSAKAGVALGIPPAISPRRVETLKTELALAAA